MTGRRTLTRVLTVGLLLVPMAGAISFSASAADFDSDGYADLAIGVEWEDVDGAESAGAVNVLYGSSYGILSAGDQVWTQNDLGASEGSEDYDGFGKVLAAGDFDGDGAADLAVGVPDEDIGTAVNSGAVRVLYGASPDGLVSAGNQLWHQNSAGVEGAVESDDRFGSALAAGDFDGDGYDDLAVGVPGESIGAVSSAGAVNVLYGTAVGLTALSDQLWYEEYNGLGGGIETGDGFGYALAAGDFDRDGYDDLAVSIAGEDLGGILNAGAWSSSTAQRMVSLP